MVSALAAALAPVAEHWAQCENANCQKWRRLPPGTVVDENAPWYCYMNPDAQRNSCSADEAEYDEHNEFVIPEGLNSDDSAQAAHLRQELGVDVHAKTGTKRGAKGRGSAGKPRGRQPRVKWEEAPGLGTGLEAAGPSGTDQDMYYADSSEEDAPPRMNWRQLSKHLVRMLESAGGAEGSGPGTSGAPPLPHPPPDVWRELGQRCPEAAEAARQALDTASAARYFPDRPSGVWEESTALANAALALAAGQVLVQNASSLPPEERERLGLGPAAPLDVTAVVERLRLGAGPGLRGTPA
ncbi:MOT13 [Auxenochlorella protothecoides x Auxenochlorella symbiontica]